MANPIHIKRGTTGNPLPPLNYGEPAITLSDEVYVGTKSNGNLKILTENDDVGGEAEKLKTPHSINGVDFDGSSDIFNYITCVTPAATAAKVTETIPGFKRVVGSAIAVKFTYANTAASPTLSVSGTTAAPIYYGALNHTSYTRYMLGTGVHYFIFDGTNWQLLNPLIVNDSAALPSYLTTPIWNAISGSVASIAGAITTGTYTGNTVTSTQSDTWRNFSVGFTPTVVRVETSSGGWFIASNNVILASGTMTSGNPVGEIITNGFRVKTRVSGYQIGSDSGISVNSPGLNTSGTSYWYAAWK